MDETNVVPLRAVAPAKRPTYSDEVMERCYVIWCSDAGMRASRTARLYAEEMALGDGVVEDMPTERTIRRWADDQGWEARLGHELAQNQTVRLYRSQMRWAVMLAQAQRVIMDGMSGELDDLGVAAAARIKSAELTLRTLEKVGALTVAVKQEHENTDEETETMSLEERETYMRDKLQARKRVGNG
jgi:hypothetical protein